MPLFKCKSSCHLFGNDKNEVSKFTSRSSVESGTTGLYGYNSKGDFMDPSGMQIVPKYSGNSQLHGTASAGLQFANGFRDGQFEGIQLKHNPAKVLLVFEKEDSQCNALRTASEKLNQQCHVVKTPAEASHIFQEMWHDIVIIDHRHSRSLDADSLCRSIRAMNISQHCIIAAVIKKSTAEKGEKTILPLLNIGFNKFIIGSTNVGLCTTELLQMERSEVKVRRQLRAVSAVYTALDNCCEAIEVTDDKHDIQYANETCKALFGYSNVELVGKTIDEVHQRFNSKPSLQDRLNSGMVWEGKVSNNTKHGKSMQLTTRILPITNQGKTEQYVYIYTNDTKDNEGDSEVKEAIRIVTSDSGQNRSGDKKVGFRKYSVISVPGGNRRQSILKKNSLIEAPITKVINLITAAQENCPTYVSQSLEKVVEILRTSDLYNPLFHNNMRGSDSVTTDLLGGLLANKTTMNFRKYSGASISTVKSSNMHRSSSPLPLAHLPRILENSNIQVLVRNWSSWEFDVIELERVTAKKPLLWLGKTIFEQFDLCSTLECSETTISNWLTLIEANYHDKNTYHNSTHAADVLQASAYFLTRDKVKELIYDPMDIAACLIAAVVHDVDHPGRTSAFLCNTSNVLAILYNDQAVLENHHAALAFKLTTSDERVNIFSGLDGESYKMIRHNIIDMVLATDMSKHFEHLARFVNNFTNATRENDQLSGGDGALELHEESEKGLDDLILVKRMLIKCADVSNPTRPLHLCMSWAERIAEEYIEQTEEEINKDLPVIMPVFNRNSCNIPKSQTSFTEFFINDLFDAWDAFAEVPELINNIKSNYTYWKEKEEEDRAKAEAKAASN